RATMLLRVNSLAQGHSGVRSAVVKQLVDFLNAGITPVVPRFGSVGASGDLAPLSHIALALIGEGDVFYEGQRTSAKEAVGKSGLPQLALGTEEVLALIGAPVFDRDQENRIAAIDAMRQEEISPLLLEMKEGLALNNGVQYSTA